MKGLSALLATVLLAGWGATVVGMRVIEAPATAPEADVIVVLGAAFAEDGRPIGRTATRFAAGLDLLADDRAPRLVFTGGSEDAAADLRRAALTDIAADRGIDPARITLELRSLSTLQNALFVAEAGAAARSDRLLLVTSPGHLPRAWGSFRWAGYRTLVPVPAGPRPGPLSRPVLWEAVKWPANIARATLADVALALGVPAPRVVPWLR